MVLGLEEYLENYGGIQRNKVHLRNHLEEFEDWVLIVPFAECNGTDTIDLKIICCPEDRRCIGKRCHASRKTVCPHCEIPICQDCENSLLRPGNIFKETFREPPARALSYELMIFMLHKVCMRII